MNACIRSDNSRAAEVLFKQFFHHDHGLLAARLGFCFSQSVQVLAEHLHLLSAKRPAEWL